LKKQLRAVSKKVTSRKRGFGLLLDLEAHDKVKLKESVCNKNTHMQLVPTSMKVETRTRKIEFANRT